MKTLRVLAHVECQCSVCGAITSMLGTAAVLPDGRIGEGEAAGTAVCESCRKAEHEQEAAAHRKARQQAKWRKWRRRENNL
jgi:hypothetical protein